MIARTANLYRSLQVAMPARPIVDSETAVLVSADEGSRA
jgi:hypothetical protein